MFKKVKSSFLKFNSIIRFFIISGLLIIFTLVILDFIFIENWRDVLIEAHGLLFDVILFGIILSIYNLRLKKREKIESLKEKLNIYKEWNKKESMHRSVGIIIGLNKLGITEIDLRGQFLSKANLPEVKLSKSILISANLVNADLSFSDLSKADLFLTNLKGANLSGANLSGADLSMANLSMANLCNADITHTDLSQTKLSEARVSTLYFFDEQMNGEDLDDIRQRYYIDQTKRIDDFDSTYYVIKNNN
jgi:hypothetical protein